MSKEKPNIAIIGAGPAGLMAAEELINEGFQPTLYDAMPTPARKFLMAGKSGLNLTHNEPIDRFLRRYGANEKKLTAAVRNFSAKAIQKWTQGLGSETFVGTSGRIFPVSFKASPLLRAWLKRLTDGGVELRTQHQWVGWNANGDLEFKTPDGKKTVQSEATLLALGGASWPRLGSTGAWQPYLTKLGVHIVPFRPANCGFNVVWSDHFRHRFAGEPIKNCRLIFEDFSVQGEFVITNQGVEGGAIYSLSAPIRDTLEIGGTATVMLDLCPDRSQEQLEKNLKRPRGKKSLATHLKRAAGLAGVKAGLLRECLPAESLQEASVLAHQIKSLPLKIHSARPVEEAISVAGGVAFDELDQNLMLKAAPGVFCAGEMIDWEAPTGGYLLTACFAQGKQAGHGIANWLKSQD